MTESERELLIWCSVMLVRDTPLRARESDGIDALIDNVRRENPQQDLTLRDYANV